MIKFIFKLGMTERCERFKAEDMRTKTEINFPGKIWSPPPQKIAGAGGEV